MKNGKHIFTKNYTNKDDAIKSRLLAEIEFFGKEFAPQRHLFDKYLGKEEC